MLFKGKLYALRLAPVFLCALMVLLAYYDGPCEWGFALGMLTCRIHRAAGEHGL